MRVLTGLALILQPPALAQHDHGRPAHSGEAQIVVTINPEARVSAAVAAPMPPPKPCVEAAEIAVKIVNQGSVTAPLRARLVGNGNGRVALHMDAAKLSGGPEELRQLHLIPLAQGATDVTLAFSIDDNPGDLGGRDRVHLLVRCGDGAASTPGSR